jgi:pimeloyl-ACP methyl ester carboxylesterase
MNAMSTRIETVRGPVDYLMEGCGPAILYFHGTPCSSRAAIDMEQELIADGFQLIVPQRPGYYGTPLGDRVTTADCADAAACVLDHLGIQRVAAIGTSGGGPPALAFAARYPDRTAALVLQCAQTHRWDDRQWAPASHRWLYECFRSTWRRRLFCRFFPILFRLGFPTARSYLRYLAGNRFPNVQNDPAALRLTKAVYSSVHEFRNVRPGYENDASAWVREDVLGTGAVTCPTLLLYDSEDPAAPICHAHYAASAIPDAELVELNAGGHLIWFGPDADRMQRRRTAFLKEHLVHRQGTTTEIKKPATNVR